MSRPRILAIKSVGRLTTGITEAAEEEVANALGLPTHVIGTSLAYQELVTTEYAEYTEGGVGARQLSVYSVYSVDANASK